MPNWVNTYINITGPKEQIMRFKEQSSKPTYIDINSTVLRDEDSPLQFWNFTAPAPHLYEEYFGTKGTIDGKEIGDTENNWYNWNLTNWGTKWDVSADLIDESSTSLTYTFDTAWSPAEKVFKSMVSQYPKLKFIFECEEETGWGVNYTGIKGNLILVEEYDAPSTHAEHAQRNQTCMCEQYTDPADWYPDCPSEENTNETNNKGENNG